MGGGIPWASQKKGTGVASQGHREADRENETVLCKSFKTGTY